MGFDHYSENKLKTREMKFQLLDILCCFGGFGNFLSGLLCIGCII